MVKLIWEYRLKGWRGITMEKALEGSKKLGCTKVLYNCLDVKVGIARLFCHNVCVRKLYIGVLL